MAMSASTDIACPKMLTHQFKQVKVVELVSGLSLLSLSSLQSVVATIITTSVEAATVVMSLSAMVGMSADITEPSSAKLSATS